MNAKKICICVICGIFLMSLAATVWIYTRRSSDNVIEIVQDNTVLYTIDADTYDGPSRLVIRCEQGQNVIHIEKGSVYVESADCADHTCMDMGSLQDSAYPIVCLPHKLVIRYAHRAETDAVSQ